MVDEDNDNSRGNKLYAWRYELDYIGLYMSRQGELVWWIVAPPRHGAEQLWAGELDAVTSVTAIHAYMSVFFF